MKPAPLCSAGDVWNRLVVFFASLIFLTAINLQAEAPPTSVRIQNIGVDAEGLRTFRLEWDSVSNATYRVQQSSSLATGAVWKTVDVITPVGSTMQYDIKGRSIPENSVEFYRLVLPQPEIFSVEPALVSPGVSVDMSVVGQCFGSNDVLRINGVPQTNVFQTSTLLSRLAFTPVVAGTYVFDLVVNDVVVSSFNVTCADAFANPELVLQGPPDEPPAIPQALIAIWASKKGYDYYQAQSQLNSAGLHNNPAFQENKNVGEMPGGHRAFFLSKKGYDYYQAQSGAARFSGGEDEDCDGEADDSFDALVQSGFFAAGDKVRICHRTAAVAGGIAGGVVAGREASVLPFSGEVQQQVVDLAVEGRELDFIWARTYRSRTGHVIVMDDTDDRWSFSYDVGCVQNSDGDMDVYDGTGRRDTFKLQTNGTYTCPEFFREGTLSNNVFRMTFADTGYWEFNPFDATAPVSKLSRIVDRNGNSMSLNYDGSGRLTEVVDDLGRTNIVAYNTAGQLASVTDFSGRTVTYAYYQAGERGGNPGDLKSVTSPPVTGTPNKNDFPAGKTTTYTYSTGHTNDAENHLLLSVIDAAGQTVSRFVYQHNQTDFDFLRCISVQRGTNTPARLTYLPQTPAPSNQFAALRCVMNDPVGNVSEYFYDARNRCVKLQVFTGRSTPGVPVTATGNRPSGKVRPIILDPDFYETRWAWNNDSLCTLETLPNGGRSIVKYEWDFDSSVSPRKKGDLRVLRQVACCGDLDSDGDGIVDAKERVWRFEYDPRFGSEPLSAAYHAINTKGTGAAGKTGSCGGHAGHAGDYIASDAGFVTFSTDPRGNESSYDYDAQGNVSRITFKAKEGATLARAFDLAYNSHGQLTAITNAADANGFRRVDTLTYFSNGSQAGYLQSIAIDEPGVQITTSFERDVRGNVTRLVDPRGNDLLFTYNALDQCVTRQTQQSTFGERVKTAIYYDATDNLVRCDVENRDGSDALVADNPQWTTLFEHDTLNRLTGIVEEISEGGGLPGSYATNRFFYDGNDNLVAVHSPLAVAGIEPNNISLNLYDERDLLFREIGAPGSSAQSTTQFDYDANGNVTRVSEGLEETPRVTTMEYDGFAGFGEVEYGLMRSGLRGTGTTPLAGSLRLIAPVAMEKELRFSAAQAWVETVWNKQCVEKDTTVRLARITDPMGNLTTFSYDANDNLKLVRHFGQTNDVPGSNGNFRLAESRYEYDALDQLVRTSDAFFDVSTQAPIGDGEATTTFSYAPNGACMSVTDDLSRVTRFTYDTACRLASVIDPKTIIVGYTYDAANNVVGVTRTERSDFSPAPQEFTVTHSYNKLHRLTRSVDNVGNTNGYAYDSRGNLVIATDPRGNDTCYKYNGVNRCTDSISYIGPCDAAGITINTSHVEYDSNSRCVASTDSNGNITQYSYDSRNRVVLFGGMDGTSRNLVWSPRSNLIREQDANGTVITNVYDLLDRCVRRDIAPASGVATTTTFETFAYDGLSRLVHASNNVSCSLFTYDSLGNKIKATQDCLAAVERTFDSVGNCLSLTYRGGTVVTYTYNALNEVASVSRSGGGLPSATLATFAYEGPGRVGRITRNNGVNTRVGWNGLVNPANDTGDFGWQQVSGVNHQIAGGGPVIDRRGYSYDRNQNKILRAQLSPFTIGGEMTTNIFDYDALDRLRLAIKTKGTSAHRNAYTLDGNGNRVNVLVMDNGATQLQEYNMSATLPDPADFQMNQYTMTPFASQQYDNKGNLVARNSSVSQVQFFYDYADRLVYVQQVGASGGMEPVVSFTYDALGRRISKTTYPPAPLAPVTTEFIHGGDDDCDGILEEWVNGALTRTYVLPQVGDEVLVAFENGQAQYYHHDDLGNVLALTDATGNILERYDYDDYGAPHFLNADGSPLVNSDGQPVNSSTLGNSFLFHGMEWDSETELYFEAWPCRWKAPELNSNSDSHRQSYYDPQTGRSITRAMTVSEAKPMAPRIVGGGGSDHNPWTKASDGKKHFEVTARWQPQNIKYVGGGGKAQGTMGARMKSGTVKFFNDAKGFGRVMKEEGGRHTPFHNK